MLPLAFAVVLAVSGLVDDYLVGGQPALRRHVPVVLATYVVAAILAIAVGADGAVDRSLDTQWLVFLIATFVARIGAPAGKFTINRGLLVIATFLVLLVLWANL